MINPGNADIVIIQGATFNPFWIMSTLAGGVDTPVDLTGYTAKLVIRRSVTSAPMLFTLTTENGGIIITGVEGKISLFISDGDTAELNFTLAVYNLDITKDGITDRILQGTVTLNPWTNF